MGDECDVTSLTIDDSPTCPILHPTIPFLLAPPHIPHIGRENGNNAHGTDPNTSFQAKHQCARPQLGQSNGSITDGPAVGDKLPSTAGQRNRPSCQEFGFGNDWAETSKIGHTTWVGPKKQSPIEDRSAHFSRDMVPIMYCAH